MNSPPDPGSPISTDTESPPPEEVNLQPSGSSHFSVNQIAQALGGGAKRRQHALGGPSGMREPKTRRRIEQGKGMGGSLAAPAWDSAPAKEGKREERDLVDQQLVEFLRKEIGDPFQESVIHQLS